MLKKASYDKRRDGVGKASAQRRADPLWIHNTIKPAFGCFTQLSPTSGSIVRVKRVMIVGFAGGTGEMSNGQGSQGQVHLQS